MNIIISAFGYKGKEFVFGFMYNTNIDDSRIQVFVVNDNTYQVTATLDGATGRLYTLNIPPLSTRDVILAGHEYVSVNVGVSNKGLLLTADGDVSVYLLNGRIYTTDGTMVYPTSILSDHYTTLSWYGPNNKYNPRAEFLIVSYQMNTGISVKLSEFQGYTITIGGATYNPGDTVSLTLGEYDTAFFKCASCDLSMTIVTSSKPVAVFCGNGQTTVGLQGGGDHLLEQATPAETWGKSFVLFGMTNQLYGPIVRILTHEESTTILFKDGKTNQAVFIGQKNTVYNLQMNSDRCATLEADKPILAALFFTGCEGLMCDPSMVYVPPVEQMTSPPFRFQRPDYLSLTLCLVIIADQTVISGIAIDDVNINLWPHRYNQKPPDTTYVVVEVCDLAYGEHSIKHRDPYAPVIVVALGVNDNQSYAIVLGRSYNKLF